MLHFILLPLLIAAFGFRALQPAQQLDTYKVTSSAVRLEHRIRPMPRSVPREVPQPRIVAKPPNPVQQPQPRRSRSIPPPVRVAYIPRLHSIAVPVMKSGQTEAKALAVQEKMYAATIAAARAANNPLSLSKAEQSPVTITHNNYNFVGSQAQTRHGDGILYPVKRWIEGNFVYYYLRYTVRYPSGDLEAGEVPWPIRYLTDQDPFARGEGERMPLPGPMGTFTAAPGTAMEPLVAHCYRLRAQFCDIMASPQAGN